MKKTLRYAVMMGVVGGLMTPVLADGTQRWDVTQGLKRPTSPVASFVAKKNARKNYKSSRKKKDYKTYDVTQGLKRARDGHLEKARGFKKSSKSRKNWKSKRKKAKSYAQPDATQGLKRASDKILTEIE